MNRETITLPLADVQALVKLGWELTNYISQTDQSATGSIYGIEHAHKAIARVAVLIDAPKPLDYLGRRFRMTGGFPGTEECLLWDGRKMWCIFKDPMRAREDVSQCYTLAFVEGQVAGGVWEEITSAP